MCWLHKTGKGRLDCRSHCDWPTLNVEDACPVAPDVSYIDDICLIKRLYHLFNASDHGPNQRGLIDLRGLSETWNKRLILRIKRTGTMIKFKNDNISFVMFKFPMCNMSLLGFSTLYFPTGTFFDRDIFWPGHFLTGTFFEPLKRDILIRLVVI